jgi:hypothetical protein
VRRESLGCGGKAASGDGKALTMLLMLANDFQQSEANDSERTVSSENDAEIIAEFLNRRAKRKDADR